MRKKITIFLLFFCLIVWSQKLERELTIILLDAETLEPVSEATATILQTNQGFVSNVDGIIKVKINRNVLIEITHSFYRLATIKTGTIKENSVEVKLVPSSKRFNEVILTGQNPQDLLKELIKKSQKKLSIPANLKIYTREFFKKNNEYAYYNDGLLNFQIFQKTNQIQTDILVEQNRAIGVIDSLDIEVMGYNLNNLIENYYQFQYLNEILDSKSKKKFVFQIKSDYENQGKQMIYVKPSVLSNQAYFEYKIIYDVKNKIILEVQISLIEDKLNNKDQSVNLNVKRVTKSDFKAVYRLEHDDYYLDFSREELGFKISQKKHEQLYEVKNYFKTVSFKRQVFKYNPAEVFTKKSLLFKPNTILTDYWNIDSGMVLTDAEKEVINNLKN